jgi:hypothetical protein
VCRYDKKSKACSASMANPTPPTPSPTDSNDVYQEHLSLCTAAQDSSKNCDKVRVGKDKICNYDAAQSPKCFPKMGAP